MQVQNFLEKHNIRSVDLDIQQLVDLFIAEMQKGLEGSGSSLEMIPTYIEADNEFLKEVPVVAIDAGGTNFRAATAKFTEGRLVYDDMVNTGMPGLDREVSKEEFFTSLADNIRTHAAECDRIGFCFSYATEIYPNKDGKLLHFSKEVQAPGVIGQMIGKSLLEALGTPDKHIVLLNDTVATLLAGKAASLGKEYDSFVGYILGTGTNTCYIENNTDILKKSELDKSKSQIINIESGNFAITPRTDIDIAFDNTTGDPGKYTFEKMISGGYLGGLCLHTLKTAANEGVFPRSAEGILAQEQLTTQDVNNYMLNKETDRGPLQECIQDKSEEEACIKILDSVIDRAALLVAANLAAVVLKTGKGKSAERPILITIEGTTFYKMHKLKPLFEKYFTEYLDGENKRYCEFIEVPGSSLAGAALAGLIE